MMNCVLSCQPTTFGSDPSHSIIMRRNSSFFWASDDLRFHGDNDDDTDEPTTPSRSDSWSHPHRLSTFDEETTDVEINPLNRNNDTYGSVGTSSISSTRRELFDLSSSSKKKKQQH